MEKEIKDIYIVHEYWDKSHFEALYKYSSRYGYKINDYIILSKKAILIKFLKRIAKTKEIVKSIREVIMDFIKVKNVKKLKNEIMIVGIAPYDKLMNKYNEVFKNNKSIYFTSWQFWDGTNFPKGNIKNREKFEKILKESFKGAACVTKTTENEMKKFFKNTQVINHAVEVKEYEKKEKFCRNKINKYLFLGKLDSRKNIPIIIEWIKNNKDKKFEFYFAGKGPLVENIIQLQEKDSRVKYLGKLSKNEIKSEINKFDYLVLPSKEEPFGIVLIEALAAAVPCIVSDALGPKEIIINGVNGFVFDKNNFNEFNNCMVKSFNISNEEYIELCKNAVSSSNIYDSKEIIKKWIKVIENI